MLALLLDRRISGRAIWRTIYYLPSIVPVVSATFLFLYIFQPDYGLINGWLWKLFEVEGPGWFNSRVWVKPTFILLALWSAGGPTMIILLAGLQNVPGEMYDAAKVDGAGRGRRFRHITLPLLSPTLFFVLITGLIAAFKIFGAVYVSTQGDPSTAATSMCFICLPRPSATGSWDMHRPWPGSCSSSCWCLP